MGDVEIGDDQRLGELMMTETELQQLFQSRERDLGGAMMLSGGRFVCTTNIGRLAEAEVEKSVERTIRDFRFGRNTAVKFRPPSAIFRSSPSMPLFQC